MVTKLTTALFLAGMMIAPAASYATGTSATHANATNAQTGDATMNNRAAAPDVRAAGDKTKASVGDAAITTKVKAKFAADSKVSAMNIHVDTDNGAVKLSGVAKSQDEAAKAEEIAKNTEGVTSVDNAIQVRASGTKY